MGSLNLGPQQAAGPGQAIKKGKLGRLIPTTSSDQGQILKRGMLGRLIPTTSSDRGFLKNSLEKIVCITN